MIQPRLRIFAGPNGSGKSTLISVLPKHLLGFYINADEIEKEIHKHQFLSLHLYDIIATAEEVSSFFRTHALITKAKLTNHLHTIGYEYNKITFINTPMNSYIASVCADFIRHKLLEKRASFTFETVMSSPDKVTFLEKAKASGYRIYLYFIATEDPIINISRVKNRVTKGGHPVSRDKIISRYYGSLRQLKTALSHTSRAYIFDNSKSNKVFLAEITEGKEVELKTTLIPFWVKKYIIDA